MGIPFQSTRRYEPRPKLVALLITGTRRNLQVLQSGVRQGHPLSGLLFVLAVEPLDNQIRINKAIKGFENGNKVTNSV